MKRINDAGVMAGGAALAAAVLLFGTMLTRAMLSAPGGMPASPEGPPPEAPVAAAAAGGEAEDPAMRTPASAATPSDALPPEVLRMAAQRAPFDPDRRAPGERYRMPGDPVELPPAPPPELPPAPDFRLLATVAGTERGVAVLQVGDALPRVLGLGEELLGYRMASIDGGGAVMAGPDRTLNLSVVGPTPTVAAAPEPTATERRRAEMAEALRSQLNTLRERYEAAGSQAERQAIQQRAETLARQIQQLSEDGPQFREAAVQGGERVIIRTPANVQVRPGGLFTRPPQGGGGGGGGGGGEPR